MIMRHTLEMERSIFNGGMVNAKCIIFTSVQILIKHDRECAEEIITASLKQGCSTCIYDCFKDRTPDEILEITPESNKVS